MGVYDIISLANKLQKDAHIKADTALSIARASLKDTCLGTDDKYFNIATSKSIKDPAKLRGIKTICQEFMTIFKTTK